MVREESVGFDDGIACPGCGTVTGWTDLRSTSGPDDPLQVYECSNCSRVIDVGTHAW